MAAETMAIACPDCGRTLTESAGGLWYCWFSRKWHPAPDSSRFVPQECEHDDHLDALYTAVACPGCGPNNGD